jgi:chaperonin cofactor prefoldin
MNDDTGTLDRLEQRKHSLEKHMSDLEDQIKETGHVLASVSEHIYRLRKKQNKIREMA